MRTDTPIDSAAPAPVTCCATNARGARCKVRVPVEGARCSRHPIDAPVKVKTPKAKKTPKNSGPVSPEGFGGLALRFHNPTPNKRNPFTRATIDRQLRHLERRDCKREDRIKAIAATAVKDLGVPPIDSPEWGPTLRRIEAEAERRFFNAPSRYAHPECAPAGTVAGPFVLEIGGVLGEVRYPDLEAARVRAQELSASDAASGDLRTGTAAIVYIDRLLPNGRKFPCGAYYSGRKVA